MTEEELDRIKRAEEIQRYTEIRCKEIKENDRRLKPIDVSKYTVTESGNVIRTDNKETLKNALERITELEIENAELRAIAENQQSSNMERYFKNKELEKENAELKGIGKTAYIKGIRTMANALKKYDREEGAWTDYFEHTVDKVLKNLLKEE